MWSLWQHARGAKFRVLLKLQVLYIYSKYTKDSKDSKYFILLAGFNSFAKSDSPVACSAQER